jgi:hypothetical protein
MARLIWRRWSAFCLLAGTIVVPLLVSWFLGNTFLLFLALPLRYAWGWWLDRPILREGWLPRRPVALGLGAICGVLSIVTLIDLLGIRTFHPGWFVALEWWQRPSYSWLGFLPRWFYGYRPDYLWIASLWTLVEGLAVSVILWRWHPEDLK